ncbi:uncharacterized protein LOC141523096 [Macrotis lagotis]|uniref:uncharacterized protein LOC141523096 n=1 Tax=Macrotis lagotis TaxID=92651 RepID=UPI003D69CB31
MRDIQDKTLVVAKVLVQSQGWADIPSVLRALTGLANLSVDLSSLTVADSHLDLQLLPISFLIINGSLKKSLLEPLTLEHEAFLTELAGGVKKALSSYSDLLQVTIQDCLNDSLICVGDLLFQGPGPKPQNLLQTLLNAVDSNGYLADSHYQVDPSSFFIAEENLKFSPGIKARAGISAAIIILSVLIVFVGIILIIKCVRHRLHYLEPQSLYSHLQGYQTNTEMIELTTQHETSEQQENPTFERETSYIQDTMEDDSASGS